MLQVALDQLAEILRAEVDALERVGLEEVFGFGKIERSSSYAVERARVAVVTCTRAELMAGAFCRTLPAESSIPPAAISRCG